MRSENMVNAYESFRNFEIQLRMAHTDAIEAEDQFAEILIFLMLEKVVEIDWRLKLMSEAAQ